MDGRRSFLKTVAAASIATSTLGTVSAEVDVTPALEARTADVPEAVDTASDNDKLSLSSVDRHFAQGSQLSILEVYETDLYGWEARVGLTSSGVYFGVDSDGEAFPEDALVRTRYRFTRSNSDLYLPDPDQGYRGFEEAANTSGSPTIPGWVEPAFDTTVSAIAGLASSNPWTGVVVGLGLSANNIVDALRQDDGKKNLSDGFEVQHTHKEFEFFGQYHAVPTATDEMEHYQRATLKMGDQPWDGHVDVEGSFSENLSGGSQTSVSFEVNIGTCDGCGIVDPSSDSVSTSDSTRDVDMANPSLAQKEKFGIVEVENGRVADPAVRAGPELKRRVRRVANSVEGREVTRVALNPPTLIRTE